jgi:thiol:disulfide interchange protein
MESAAKPAALLQLPRFAAAMLTLISAGCLTLSYAQEGWFGRMLRIGVGLALPWIIASVMPGNRLSRRSYWFRLVFSYFGVIVTGGVVILIWPLATMILMDSGLM